MPGTHPAPDGNRLLPNPPQEPPGRAQKLPGAPGGMRPCPPLAVPNTSWLPTALSQRWFPVGVFHHPGVGLGGPLQGLIQHLLMMVTTGAGTELPELLLLCYLSSQ